MAIRPISATAFVAVAMLTARHFRRCGLGRWSGNNRLNRAFGGRRSADARSRPISVAAPAPPVLLVRTLGLAAGFGGRVACRGSSAVVMPVMAVPFMARAPIL